MIFLYTLLCCLLGFVGCDQPKLSLITGELFGTKSDGIVAAFGDFNSDKHTDIFMLNDTGKTVDIMLASLETTYTRKTLIKAASEHKDHVITSVVPGDFNGDTQMDVLVTWQQKDIKHGPITTEIYWGDSKEIKTDGKTTINETFVDQPLIFDVNGDMIPDLLAETSPGNRFYWKASQHKNFTKESLTPSSITHTPFRVPQGHAFTDLDGDFNADLLLTTRNGFEVWLNKKGNFTLDHNITLPTAEADWNYIGQPTVVDIDQNAEPDIILPMCKDGTCKIMATKCKPVEWVTLFSDFRYDGKTWSFVPHSTQQPYMNLPITLRMGDYNMDGFPDATVILQDSNNSTKTRAFLLENIASSQTDGQIDRTFSLDGQAIGDVFESPYLSTFYDIKENGVLDLLVMTWQRGASYVKALEHSFTSDACFVKVTVVGGLCYSSCPNGKPPYGVNQPGPTVKYTTTKAEGDTQTSMATQLSQAAHFALQLPFIVFGIGQTPNFVEKLEVGIPTSKKEVRKKGWTQTIPNSQLIIVPYPNDTPKDWKNKLFVTPSRLVLLTGAALIGTCGFIAGIVGILQWREKREDKKEKLQDAHRFHFDAM